MRLAVGFAPPLKWAQLTRRAVHTEVNTPAQKQKAVLRPPQQKAAAPKLLSRIEALRLLSKVEDAGLLSLGAFRGLRRLAGAAISRVASSPGVSKVGPLNVGLTPFPPPPPLTAEKAGFTLSRIESLGLLSKAESLGALSLATDRNTPSVLTLAGLALFVAAAGVVVAVPDTDTTLLVAQGAGAAVLGGVGLGLLVGSTILGDLQK